MNQTLRDLISRRSCRKYTKEQVDPVVLDAILKAGTYAPTARGQQSPLMVVVQDQDTIAQLTRMNAEFFGAPGTDPFYGAPTIVIVLADRTNANAIKDGSLVMGNLMNAAHSLGIAYCWINRAQEEFDGDEGKALLEKWGITGDYIGVGHCTLGYADGPTKEAAPRKADYIHWVK